MDYLDPQKKKAHKRRITIGYILFAIVIMFATILLVFIANGYDIDPDTGEVIQNGLIFVDSQPTNADVYLNGVKQGGQTDARLVVPAGDYDIGIFRPGYYNWTRQLRLEGGSLRRITYPRLIPETLETTVAVTLRSDPIFASQSINNRFFVLSYADTPLNLTLVDVSQTAPVAKSLIIPSATFTSTEPGVVEVVEWAANNRHFLATYTVDDAVEYFLVDTEQPDEAVNLSTLFGKPGATVELNDRRIDRYFVYDPVVQSLFTATDTSISLKPVLTDVIAYKNFGSDWTLYVVQPETSPDTEVQVRLKRGDRDILIQTMPIETEYMLELARLGNAPIIGIGSTVQERTIVYNDPENFLNNNPEASKPVATAVLRTVNLQNISISSDSSVIIAVGSDSYAAYEFEADRSYRTTHGETVVDGTQDIRWADGQHYIFASKQTQIISDFDGSNRYSLVSSTPVFGSYFSDDVSTLYTVTAQQTNDNGEVTTPASLNATSLLILADQ